MLVSADAPDSPSSAYLALERVTGCGDVLIGCASLQLVRHPQGRPRLKRQHLRVSHRHLESREVERTMSTHRLYAGMPPVTAAVVHTPYRSVLVAPL